MQINLSLPDFTGVQGNTPEVIADIIRKAIFDGTFKAGQPLRQDQIAQALKISKIPIREALVQLKAEGLVVFLPNRGALVSRLSQDEVKEIFSMRLALESLAVQNAIPNFSEADSIRAQGILQIIEKEKDRKAWNDLNWEFHEILYRPSGMKLLLNSIRVLHNNVARYLIVYLDHLSGATASGLEHWEILKAYQMGDEKKAVQFLELHLVNAQKCLLGYLEKE